MTRVHYSFLLRCECHITCSFLRLPLGFVPFPLLLEKGLKKVWNYKRCIWLTPQASCKWYFQVTFKFSLKLERVTQTFYYIYNLVLWTDGEELYIYKILYIYREYAMDLVAYSNMPQKSRHIGNKSTIILMAYLKMPWISWHIHFVAYSKIPRFSWHICFMVYSKMPWISWHIQRCHRSCGIFKDATDLMAY